MCDGKDDCGDFSDEEFEVVCKGYNFDNFEDMENPLGLFTMDGTSELTWVWTAPNRSAEGKMPMFDHTFFTIEGHYVHVGGVSPKVSADGFVIGRLNSVQFVRMEEKDEDFNCIITMYYFNMGVDSTVGSLKILLSHQ